MQNRGPRSVSTSPQVRARHRQAYLTGRAHRGSGTLRPNLRPSNEIYSEGARTPLPTSSKPWQCDLSSRFQGPRPSRPAPGGTTARPGARSQSCGDRGPPGPLHSIGPGSVSPQQGQAATAATGPRPRRPFSGRTTARPAARSQNCGDRGPPGPLHSIPGSVYRGPCHRSASGRCRTHLQPSSRATLPHTSAERRGQDRVPTAGQMTPAPPCIIGTMGTSRGPHT